MVTTCSMDTIVIFGAHIARHLDEHPSDRFVGVFAYQRRS